MPKPTRAPRAPAGLLPPPSPTLDLADLAQVLADLHEAQSGVVALKGLLYRSALDALDNATGTGLGLLLEGVRVRLELSAETLLTAAELAGLQNARNLYAVRA